jgi:hypothetical protein
VRTEKLGPNTHHTPEHPHNKMTSDINIRCTVKKPQTALETDTNLHVLATITSHQAMSPTMEMDMATMKERKFEESEEHEETNVTNADRNMHDKKEKSDKKLMITRHQVCDMDSIKTVVKRHGSVVKAHETPHNPTASPPEESLQIFEKNEPSPTLLQVRSLNRTKLKLSSVQNQDDLTATLAPQHMEKVHKDDSSDYEHEVKNAPLYKLKMAVRSVKKRKYEVLTEMEEIDETPTARDAIMGNSTHENSALDDNDEYEQQEHQTSLDDVPQPITQVQTCHHNDEEKDAKLTNRLYNKGMETGQITQPSTQPPEERTESPKTEKNRSLEKNNEINQTSSDDKDEKELATVGKLPGTRVARI